MSDNSINKFMQMFETTMKNPSRKNAMEQSEKLKTFVSSLNDKEKKAIGLFLNDRKLIINNLLENARVNRPNKIENSASSKFKKVMLDENKLRHYDNEIEKQSTLVKDTKKRKGFCGAIKQYFHCALTGDFSELEDDQFVKKYLIPFLYFVSEKFASCDDAVIEAALIRCKVPEKYKPALRKTAKSFKGFINSKLPKDGKMKEHK